jgi:hypothetical protein
MPVEVVAMYDEHELLTAPPQTLRSDQVVRLLTGAHGGEWSDRLSWSERDVVRQRLGDALVERELTGDFTTPDLLAAYTRLGGSEDDLDTLVISRAAGRAIVPAGLAVVWCRLLRVQEGLSEAEVRAWLVDATIRGLAADSVTWSRFSAIALGDWARRPASDASEDALAHRLIGRHPRQSAAVLAQAMREQPARAGRLADRIESGSPESLVALAKAIVDDRSIPSGVRIVLAGRADEAVRTRARSMVVRELGVSESDLARLAPEDDETGVDGASPGAVRLAWVLAGGAFFLGSFLGLGLDAAFMVMLLFFVIAWFAGRDPDA